MQAAIGDSVKIVGHKFIKPGENVVRWEIVSGTGKFIDATEDSTRFIPSSNQVVLKVITRTLPTAYEINGTKRALYYDTQSSKIPYIKSYGIRMFYTAGADSVYAFHYGFNQTGFGYTNFRTDSTFSKMETRFSNDNLGGIVFIKATPNRKNYFFFYLYTTGTIFYTTHDSLTAWIEPAYTITASASGGGKAYIDSSKTMVESYSRGIASKSTNIYAVANTDNTFDHWEVTSGSCTITDPKKENTSIKNIKSACNVKAFFKAGTIYQITSVPTEYNFIDHNYATNFSKGHAGVRFSFTAPSAGTYSIIVSNDRSQSQIIYYRYASSDYGTMADSIKFSGTKEFTLNLSAGQTIAIVVGNSGTKANPFYISYSTQRFSLILTPDSNGSVTPSNGYPTAYTGANYSIAAQGRTGYRFSNWQIVSGTPTITDTEAAYTYASINGNAEVKAIFKPSKIHKLSTTKKEFNYQKDYYNESTKSTIRFTWDSPDTNSYILRFEPVDSVAGIIRNYTTDSAFTRNSTALTAYKTASMLFKGIPDSSLYFTVTDTTSFIRDMAFNLWISTPYYLTVNAGKGGATNPSGTIATRPQDKTILTAWPHGGYKFKTWEKVKGDPKFTNQTEPRATTTPADSICVVKAVFEEDPDAQPYLEIAELDLTNYPRICAQVSATDLNSGHTFYGLTEEDLVLTQDGKTVKAQVTSSTTMTGVSVVIVVDESGSMDGSPLSKAQKSIKNFINEMGPFDRTALVAFSTNARVLQTMTSNKSALLKAVDSLIAGGSTFIVNGTYTGLEQIVNESNPTAVIVFSDGSNDSQDNLKVDATVALAKSKKTTIHSISLATNSKFPLEDLAKKTGGIYTSISDASELAGIYSSIRDNILSQYLVCFETPDTVQNSETHTVTISTVFNSIIASDSAKWNEGALPPTISLTEDTWKLVQNKQDAGVPFNISVYISAPLKIESANIYLRQSNIVGNPFTKYNLTNVRDSLWEFSVPASLIQSPGIDFYVTATDTANQTGKTPKIQNPGLEPYTIFIGNDIPDIKAISVSCEDSTSSIKTFSFQITDSDGIDKATLYYRDFKGLLVQELPFTYSYTNDTWNIELDANSDKFSRILYYIRATDGRGATVRYKNSGYLTTDACQIKAVIPPPDDSLETDTIPEDTSKFTRRDSIEYSLIADTAEIYDKDLDGKADFVRIHFKEEKDDNVSSIDSIFWNSNRGEWRFAPNDSITKNKNNGKWVEAYINMPYKYGLTKADTVRKPFLSFSTVYSDKMENVILTDRVGAVPLKAIKRHGKVDLERYMSPSSEPPPDTLIVFMSEPIKNTGDDNAWENIFRYSTSCKDTVTHFLHIKAPPTISENGMHWNIILNDFTLKAGYCLRTNPKAKYKDLEGNRLGQGGVTIEGNNSTYYLSEVKPLKAVSGIGSTPDWLAPGSSIWEPLPDSLTAISVKALAPYTAEIYIFDAIANYVTHFEQSFGYDGEMDDPERLIPEDQSKLGFLYWNQRTKKGRKVGTGVYIWKILFTFDDGYKETVFVKTGIKRHGKKRK